MPRCRYCQEEINFIRDLRGHRIPVEIEPVTVITNEGVTIKKAFIPHKDNCEGYDQDRMRGAKAIEMVYAAFNSDGSIESVIGDVEHNRDIR